ncbi:MULTISPECIES: hypothetical protein [unclassified Lysobacter]|uniref:hypothetical protein n=1 Tax=unclassified Lysobacter TaxID=2635362 RepID=UPI001BEA5E17|nr:MULTISPECIES: hypothetical protein [unclassified Lysobacter]MBT2746229.1 hypothetical protein [Lysobacter sp. ISL-42]MBT2750773.1 hypothetical protein [Lysobacter sp. ISL-50]MBT2776080.1 hypothetical protein [Lysobacter sp. ISL-54]MBT2784586.1 hypothetical protein [Lysobacter sp. ISL-52]
MDAAIPHRSPVAALAERLFGAGRPLFGLIAIGTAGLFAGLMASGLMIACNYAALGRRRAAWLTGVASVLVIAPGSFLILTMLLVLNMSYFGGDIAWVMAVALIAQPLIALAWAATAQGRSMKALASAGYPTRPGWHAAAMVLAAWLLWALGYVVLRFGLDQLVFSRAHKWA